MPLAPRSSVGRPAGAAGADDEAAQQPAFFVGVEPAGGEVGVLGAGSGGGVEGGVVDDGRAGHQDPLLLGASDLAGSLSRAGFHLGAVEVEPPDIDLPAEQAPDGAGGPSSPGGRGDAVAVETDRDLADRAATGDVLVEDPPDHGRLLLVDDQVSESLPGAGNARVSRKELASRPPPRPGPGTACPAWTVR